MSKTDKTRPWWVRATEHPMITCVPVHNHALGPCTLPEDPREGFRYAKDACYWSESTQVWFARGAGCGCPSCTDQVARKAKRRRERRQARLDLSRFDPQDY